MSAWVLVPSLVALREEFNLLAPGRDKGADGSIGDSAHTSSSDHTPDEDSDVLRDHDADHKNEVHALDIDSTGPWPAASFDARIKALVEREKAEYNSPTMVGRLKYVIWNHRIAERSRGWAWRPYTLSDPHTNHAHFSARYETGPESDTRPWGVFVPPAPAKEIDVAFSDDKVEISETTGKELFEPDRKAGTEVDAGTLLQLAAIWAKRGAVDAAAVEQRLTAMEADIAAIKAAVVSSTSR